VLYCLVFGAVEQLKSLEIRRKKEKTKGGRQLHPNTITIHNFSNEFSNFPAQHQTPSAKLTAPHFALD
jgi:hypothetical protein